MDRIRFADSPIGTLVPIRGTDGRTGEPYDHVAFIPAPLGEEPPLTNAAWRAVTAAHRALGALDQAGQQVPEPSILRRPTLRREAQSTSALEGTFAPLAEVLGADEREGHGAELAEVLNYVSAAELAYNALSDGHRLSLTLLTELHRHLVRGTGADTRDAGRVRSIQVAIGGRSSKVTDARFVPSPPGLELEAALRDLLDWTNRTGADQRDPVVSAAIAHYQFETLHPFNDGNGRLGRLLIVLGLLQEGVIREPLLTVSPWFEARRRAYQDGLAELSVSGDWSSWVEFFARGVEESARDTIVVVDRLLALSESYAQRLRDANVRGVAVDVAASLVAKPILTVRDAADASGKGYQTASNALQKLQELGVLVEYGSSYPKRFLAPEVLTALTS
jgi:Fic family protein